MEAAPEGTNRSPTRILAAGIALAVLVMLVIWYVVAGGGRVLERGVPLPSQGAPRVGVVYRTTLYCGGEFQVGSTTWVIGGGENWPPAMPSDDDVIRTPHDVPGVLTLNSATEGVFTADVNGQRLPVRFVRNGEPQMGCV